MDLIGIRYETQITGKSAKPIIEGKVNLHRDAYMEATGITLPNKNGWLAGIRIDNKFKFIYSPFRDDIEDELYDLHKDPEEKNNIALENEDLIKVLKNKIEEMKTEKFVGEKIDKETQKLILKRLKTLGYLD